MSTLKRKLIGLSVVFALLASAGAAYAYYSSTGSGTGSATAAVAEPIQLSSAPVGGFYPGAGINVSVHVYNPGPGVNRVYLIKGTVVTQGDCLGSWFGIPPSTTGADPVPPGGSFDTNVAVYMNDAGVNQDACQGKTMTINWTSG